MKLTLAELEKARDKFDSMNIALTEYENYIEDNGLPYCDYKMYRTRNTTIKPIQKFQYGIHRIMRIVKSYQSSGITDVLKKVRDQIEKEKHDAERNKRRVIMRSVPKTKEGRNEQTLLKLDNKMDMVINIIKNQNNIIEKFKNSKS